MDQYSGITASTFNKLQHNLGVTEHEKHELCLRSQPQVTCRITFRCGHAGCEEKRKKEIREKMPAVRDDTNFLQVNKIHGFPSNAFSKHKWSILYLGTPFPPG